MSTVTSQVVGMGLQEVRKGAGHLTCTGLGSCLAVLAYDPITKVAGVANVMLPEFFGSGEPPKARFANTAVQALLEAMVEYGADQTRIQAAIVGGARMFRLAAGTQGADLGGRNRSVVLSKLEEQSIPCIAEDTGGDAARTVHFDCGTGVVLVRTTGLDKPLCRLGG